MTVDMLETLRLEPYTGAAPLNCHWCGRGVARPELDAPGVPVAMVLRVGSGLGVCGQCVQGLSPREHSRAVAARFTACLAEALYVWTSHREVLASLAEK